jgi:hypothetical protein
VAGSWTEIENFGKPAADCYLRRDDSTVDEVTQYEPGNIRKPNPF